VTLPACETSLVWPAHAVHPALARFVEFVRERTHKRVEERLNRG
jgi:hypothetical protein